MKDRPRRLRQNAIARELMAETDLKLSQLIQPYFLADGASAQEPITGFTEIYRWGVDTLSQKIETDLQNGVKSFLFFGGAIKKDERGSEAYDSNAMTARALRAVKKRFGDAALLFVDICLCPYTSHGHCGVMRGDEILNDPSLELLAKASVMCAEAGADFVAPSDMMDGRVGAIREALDAKGLANTGILAYTAKYASSYYGPFREALSSSPTGGVTDRATYQMDFRNSSEALRELELDLAEGADMVMVKPALAYLDIIAKFRAHSTVPTVAYSVSGEYEMVKQLAKAGMADERNMALENLTAIRRAGAHAVITYFASRIGQKGWLK